MLYDTVKSNKPYFDFAAGPRGQSVTCLTTDADPGVASSIPALPLSHSRRVGVRYKRQYVHEVLVNRLFKLVQEKKCG